jgi:hypothetical protein
MIFLPGAGWFITNILGQAEGDGFVRYFIRRGEAKTDDGSVESEEQALEKDKQQAKEYEWRVRIRSTGHQQSTVYCRNFSWNIGQPVSFEEKDAHPCSIEAFLGALAPHWRRVMLRNVLVMAWKSMTLKLPCAAN